MSEFLDWVKQNPALAAGLIGVAGVVIGGCLNALLWPTLKNAVTAMWDWLRSRYSRKHVEKKYLNWVVEQHRFLPILPTTLVPVTESHRHELDRLYVTLQFAGAETKDSGFGPLFANHHRLVIIGEPGAGKTTMLRFLALNLARARGGRSGQSAVDGDLEMMRQKAARQLIRNELGLRNQPLPVFAYLNRLRDQLSGAESRGLLKVLLEDLRTVTALGKVSDNFLEARLECGDCVFLLDAFDELGSQDSREAVARHIGELATASASGNRFIVTSRIVGYSGQFAQYGFETVTIQQLSWGLVAQLVTKWYEVLKEPDLGNQLLETLKLNPRISELAVNPMLLSLIALVQYVKRIIPDKRHVLYEECVRILVERRFASPAIQAHYNAVVPGEEAVLLLARLAYLMHQERSREIPRGRLENVILPEILASLQTTAAASVSPRDIVRNIEQRSELLVERGLSDQGEPLMAFSHLTFQEYLAAMDLKQAIAIRSLNLVTDQLLQFYVEAPEWWEEVALLFAAQLGPAQQEVFLKTLSRSRQSYARG